MNALYEKWIELKNLEKETADLRRLLEDVLIHKLNISDSFEGTMSVISDDIKVKIIGRMTRKIDSDKLQELANENGIDISTLFRWKPEINTLVWKATHDDITKHLMGAITTVPARASFSITKEQ